MENYKGLKQNPVGRHELLLGLPKKKKALLFLCSKKFSSYLLATTLKLIVFVSIVSGCIATYHLA